MDRRRIPPPAHPSKLDMEPRFFKLGDGTWAVHAHGAPPDVGDVIPVRRSDGIVRSVVVTSLVTKGDRVRHEMWVARTEEPSSSIPSNLILAVKEARSGLFGYKDDPDAERALNEYVSAVDELLVKLHLILEQK